MNFLGSTRRKQNRDDKKQRRKPVVHLAPDIQANISPLSFDRYAHRAPSEEKVRTSTSLITDHPESPAHYQHDKYATHERYGVDETELSPRPEAFDTEYVSPDWQRERYATQDKYEIYEERAKEPVTLDKIQRYSGIEDGDDEVEASRHGTSYVPAVPLRSEGRYDILRLRNEASLQNIHQSTRQHNLQSGKHIAPSPTFNHHEYKPFHFEQDDHENGSSTSLEDENDLSLAKSCTEKKRYVIPPSPVFKPHEYAPLHFLSLPSDARNEYCQWDMSIKDDRATSTPPRSPVLDNTTIDQVEVEKGNSQVSNHLFPHTESVLVHASNSIKPQSVSSTTTKTARDNENDTHEGKQSQRDVNFLASGMLENDLFSATSATENNKYVIPAPPVFRDDEYASLQFCQEKWSSESSTSSANFVIHDITRKANAPPLPSDASQSDMSIEDNRATSTSPRSPVSDTLTIDKVKVEKRNSWSSSEVSNHLNSRAESRLVHDGNSVKSQSVPSTSTEIVDYPESIGSHIFSSFASQEETGVSVNGNFQTDESRQEELQRRSTFSSKASKTSMRCDIVADENDRESFRASFEFGEVPNYPHSVKTDHELSTSILTDERTPPGSPSRHSSLTPNEEVTGFAQNSYDLQRDESTPQILKTSSLHPYSPPTMKISQTNNIMAASMKTESSTSSPPPKHEERELEVSSFDSQGDESATQTLEASSSQPSLPSSMKITQTTTASTDTESSNSSPAPKHEERESELSSNDRQGDESTTQTLEASSPQPSSPPTINITQTNDIMAATTDTESSNSSFLSDGQGDESTAQILEASSPQLSSPSSMKITQTKDVMAVSTETVMSISSPSPKQEERGFALSRYDRQADEWLTEILEASSPQQSSPPEIKITKMNDIMTDKTETETSNSSPTPTKAEKGVALSSFDVQSETQILEASSSQPSPPTTKITETNDIMTASPATKTSNSSSAPMNEEKCVATTNFDVLSDESTTQTLEQSSSQLSSPPTMKFTQTDDIPTASKDTECSISSPARPVVEDDYLVRSPSTETEKSNFAAPALQNEVLNRTPSAETENNANDNIFSDDYDSLFDTESTYSFGIDSEMSQSDWGDVDFDVMTGDLLRYLQANNESSTRTQEDDEMNSRSKEEHSYESSSKAEDQTSPKVADLPEELSPTKESITDDGTQTFREKSTSHQSSCNGLSEENCTNAAEVGEVFPDKKSIADDETTVQPDGKSGHPEEVDVVTESDCKLDSKSNSSNSGGSVVSTPRKDQAGDKDTEKSVNEVLSPGMAIPNHPAYAKWRAVGLMSNEKKKKETPRKITPQRLSARRVSFSADTSTKERTPTVMKLRKDWRRPASTDKFSDALFTNESASKKKQNQIKINANEFSSLLNEWKKTTQGSKFEILSGGVLSPLKEQKQKRKYRRSWPKKESYEEAYFTNTNFCPCSMPFFSGNEDMIDFFLPKVGMSCTCGKQSTKSYFDRHDPTSLENILRPWQVDFLRSFGMRRGDEFIKAHHKYAGVLAKSMVDWRVKNDMIPVRTVSCGMALHIWSRTCKIHVRSIRKQLREGVEDIKPPSALEVLAVFVEKVVVPEEELLSPPVKGSGAVENSEVEV